MSNMFWKDVQNIKPRDYNALVDLMKEEIISEEMAQGRDSHAQPRCNQGGQANVKPSDGVVRNQTRYRQGSSMRPFSGKGSSYTAEIVEAIINLHAKLNTPTYGKLAGKAGIIKQSIKSFIRPYFTFHKFYGHKTEECHDIQMLADQRT
ncbi:Uncharacterized protein Adt_20754 [Abeliophyllum distichum]|uniref:Uncharacterized protein n=1 Tax=Abeliophyllum distichum TaxID=126358 RepID=A0ABD1SXJ3_9LAMI